MDFKTDTQWTQDVLKMLMEINVMFPELTKYIEEMPVKSSCFGADITLTLKMEAYYESLEMLIRKYELSHEASLPITLTSVIR